MKKFTKVLAIVLTIATVMTAMTGCSLFGPKNAADLLEKSEKAMASEKGYTIDMNAIMDADLDLDFMGAEMAIKLPISIDAEMDVYDNSKVHGTMEMSGSMKATVEMDGEKQEQSEKLDEEMEFYIDADDKNITTYQKDSDGDWTYSKTENSEDKFDLGSIKDVIDKAEMTKEKDGYVISMNLVDFMDSKAFDDIMKEADIEDTLKDSGLKEDDIKEIFKDVKVKYTFDKKYRVTGFSVDTVEIDLGDLLKDLSEEMSKSDADVDLGELSALLEGGIKKATISFSLKATIGGYGEVTEEDVAVSKSIKDEAVEESSVVVDDEDIDIDIEDEDEDEDKDEDVEDKNDDKPAADDDKTDKDNNTSSNQTTNGKIDSDWTKLDIAVDGVIYNFPYDFAKLKSNGWTLDLAKYGKENGYILNPGDKTYSTLDLYSTKYGSEYDSFSITCGFKNYDNSAKDITECDLWSVSMAIDYGSRLKKNYPEVEVAKGIKFGAKEADVLAAFGTPDDTYESTDLGYKTFTYDKDGIKARFKVSNEFGLVQIEYQNYN